MPLANHILLSGPPGVGKSTVGEQAAHLMHCVYSDTDQLIRLKSGRTAGEIIRRKGERYFRNMEARVLEAIPPRPHRVIGLGGGFLTTAPGRAAARRTGLVLGLKATAETIAARLTGDATDRPLSDANNIQEVMAARWESYRAVDAAIDAETSPEEVSHQIVHCAESYRVDQQELREMPVRILSGPDLRAALFGLVSYPCERAEEAMIVCDDDAFDASALREALATRRADPAAEANAGAIVSVGVGSAEALVAALDRLPQHGPRHLIWLPKNLNELASARARAADGPQPDVGLAIHILGQTASHGEALTSSIPASGQDLPFG